MNGIYVLLQPVGRLLISLLISKWGLPVLLLGMTALAGSTAIYLSSTADNQARPGFSGPNGATIGTGRGNRCWRDFVPSTPHTCGLLGR